MTDNFNYGLKDDFDVLCNMVSVLSRKYDCVTKVAEFEDYEEEERT